MSEERRIREARAIGRRKEGEEGGKGGKREGGKKGREERGKREKEGEREGGGKK